MCAGLGAPVFSTVRRFVSHTSLDKLESSGGCSREPWKMSAFWDALVAAAEEDAVFPRFEDENSLSRFHERTSTPKSNFVVNSLSNNDCHEL